MKKKITTILLTFAIAITGINTPADQVNAETKEAKTTAEATSETPAETVAPTATPTPVIGDVRGDSDDTYEIYNGTGWEKLVSYGNGMYYDWSGGSFRKITVPRYDPSSGRNTSDTKWEKPAIGAYRGNNDPYDTEIYTENGWKKVEWKIGECWGNLRYTIYGWMSCNDERYAEAMEAEGAAAAAERAKKPHDIRIGIINESREEKTTMLEDGDTAEITKGFDTELSFKATGDASPNWTSSNPEAVAITKTTQNKDKKTAVLTGKNYGTSVVTAEYNGSKISITIKVMKNERRYDEKTRDWGCSGKKKTMEYTADCSAVVSYDKKGNLVVKYTEKNFKWKKSKAKSKIVFKGLCITMSDEKGKTVFNNEVKNFRMTVHPKKKTASVTVKVKRKYLKKKKTQDLRKCSFMTMKRVGKTVKK